MSLPVRCPGRAPILARARNQATDLLRRLADEARRVEQDLRRTGPVTTAADHQRRSRDVPTASTQLSTVLAQLADERSGPLATVRDLIEHTVHRASVQPGTSPDTAHRLELIALRLYGIQQDLDTTAARLTARPIRPPATPVVPTTRASARHSP